MSRSRIDPNTRDGEIDGLLRQLSRVLQRGPKSRDGGLLPIVSMALQIRERARRENRAVEWRYPNDVSMGFDRTPVMFLRPEPAKVIDIKPYLERRAGGG